MLYFIAKHIVGCADILTTPQNPACAAYQEVSESTPLPPINIRAVAINMLGASCYPRQLDCAHACQHHRVLQLCVHGAHTHEQLVSSSRMRGYTRAITRRIHTSSRTQRFRRCTASSAAQIQTAEDSQPALPPLVTQSWHWRSHKINYAVRVATCDLLTHAACCGS